MPLSRRRARDFIDDLFSDESIDEKRQRLRGEINKGETLKSIPAGVRASAEQISRRWAILAESGREACEPALYDEITQRDALLYQGNIENFVGTVKLPVGVAGPIRVNGLFASGDFYVPMATSEAALVASYHRGCRVISEAGGCSVVLTRDSISRAPGFVFETLAQAAEFSVWVASEIEQFREEAAKTTSHGKLVDFHLTLEGNHVYLQFEYSTEDAAGQNMVTIATQQICNYILEHTPIPVKIHYVEANMSGDKKASMLAFLSVRGKKVTAEVSVSEELVRKKLNSSPTRMVDYWRMSAMGGVMSGTIGVQGHYANGMAALYIACGQDAACVAESAVGVTRMEVKDDGGLYACVTLPNLTVGTVGGGTGLPSQKGCLEIMGLHGTGKARAFAEVTAAVALAGELSIIAALSAGDFTKAHQNLARIRKALNRGKKKT